MNRCYRLVFNPVLRAWTVVSEAARGRGKGERRGEQKSAGKSGGPARGSASAPHAPHPLHPLHPLRPRPLALACLLAGPLACALVPQARADTFRTVSFAVPPSSLGNFLALPGEIVHLQVTDVNLMNNATLEFNNASMTGLEIVTSATGAPISVVVNPNSFMRVRGGTARIGDAFVLPTIMSQVSSVTVDQNARFEINDFSATVRNLQGAGTINLGTFSGTTLTLQSGNFSGAISGSGQLTKDSAGTLVLSGANSYSGGTTLSQGTLQVGSGAADGSTGTLGSGSVSSATGTSLVFNRHASTGTYTVNNSIGGGLALTQSGGNTIVLNGNNSYSGGTTISSGTLAVGSNSALGSGAVTLSGGELLGMANLNLSSGKLTFAASTTSTLAAANGTTLTYSAAGMDLGNGAVARFGSAGETGTIVLSAAGGGSNVAGNSTMEVVAGTLRAGDGRLGTITANAASVTVNGRLELAGFNTGIKDLRGFGAIDTGSGTVFDSLSIGAGNYSGAITGSLPVNKTGTGTLILSGASGASTYSGATTISGGGTIQTGSANTLSANSAYVINNGTLNLNGSSQVIGSLAGDAGSGVALGSATLTTGGDNSSTTFAGNITDGGAGGGLTKAGAGTMALLGANNYAGTTQVSGGILQVGDGNNTGTLGSGAVIGNGGTLAINRSDGVTLAGQLTGSLNLTQMGGGTTTLTSVSNDYTGATVISGGTLQIGDGNGTGKLGTGAVSGSGTLAVNRNNSVTLSAAIGDNLSFVQTGTGVTTLTGSNTYTGTTTINAGRLQIGDNGTTGSLGSGQVNMNNSSALDFLRDGTLNVSNTITGSGRLTQGGAGTVTLSGSNSYDGGTTVTGGTLVVASQNALGTGNVAMGSGKILVAAPVAFWDMPTLGVMANETATIAVADGGAVLTHTRLTAGANSTLVFGSTTERGRISVDLDLGANIDSSAKLRVAGGTLASSSVQFGGYLENFNTVTVDSGATLLLNSLGYVSRLEGAGTVSLSGSGARVREGLFSGTFDGTGTLEKGMSANTFVLTGSNNSSGGTKVSQGTLQVGDGNANGSLGSGAIDMQSGTLAYNRSDNPVIANQISGTGTVRQMGSGNLILTGNSSGFTGTLEAAAGRLSVNGTVGGSASVLSGGTLGGNGSIGTTTVMGGGVLAPGNSIGTLTVNGNLTFAAGSVYRVELDAAGNADRVNVIGAPGTLTINGGTVDVQAGAGTYKRNTQYTILTSLGGRTGNFAGVTSNLAFLTPTLVYDAANVYLNLQSGNAPSAYAGVATTANQRNVANYLNTFANNPGNAQAEALIKQIDNLTAGQARNAFDSLSGSQHAGASQVGLAGSRAFAEALNARIGGSGGGGGFTGTGAIRGNAFGLGSPALPWNGADAPVQLAGMFGGAGASSGLSAASSPSGLSAASSPSGLSAASSPSGLSAASSLGGLSAASSLGGAVAGSGMGGNVNSGAAGGNNGGARETGMAASGQSAGDAFGIRRADWGANTAGQNGLWGQALGGGGRIASDGNGAGSSYRAGGFMVGYDRTLSDQWLVGAAGGYNRATWDANTNGVAPGSGRVETPQGALYARYAGGPWMASFTGSYADHKFDTSRTVTIGTSSSVAASTHHGREWGFTAQAEYALAAGAWQVRPLASLRYSNLREDSFAESGTGAGNLGVDARATRSTTVSGGVRLLRPLSGGAADGGAANAAFSGIELRAVASHLFGDNDSPVSARLAGQAASFTSTGTPLKRDALTVGAGVSGRVGRSLTAFADVSYEARGSGQDAYAIGAGLKYVW